MGGLSRIAMFGAGAAIASTIGFSAGSLTSRLSDDAEDRARTHADEQGEPFRPSGDKLLNLDGGVRLAMAGAAVIGVPAAIGAAMLHRPRAAAGILGASVALAGASVLSGSRERLGGPDLLKRNLASMGSTLNAGIHAALPSSNPRFRDHVPRRDAGDTVGTGTRPTAAQLRATPLTLMPGAPDLEAARREATNTLDRIDWSKPDIVLWVPGTGAHEVAPEFADGVRAHLGDRATLTHVDYPASVDFAPSVSTGMETLRLVLAGIAERGGDHRVSIAGHSQGAWVVADAMAEPAIHDMVDRATIFGTPGMAQRHYTDRRDAKVIEINDSGDPITFPVALKADLLSGIGRLEQGDKLGGGVELVKTAASNPGQVSYLLARQLQPERWSGQRDPHHYEELFDEAAEWLGTPGAAPDAERKPTPTLTDLVKPPFAPTRAATEARAAD